ncbi:peptidase [Salinibaculum salinum]|uniref:peptidase n=1 Tax=Salinibaculum salinum TaxID=3131996 RepID=UPI0030EC75E0
MNRQDGVTVCLVVALVVALASASGAAVAGDSPSERELQTAPVLDMGQSSNESDSAGQSALATGPQTQTSDNTIHIDQKYRLTPGEPGQVEVRWTVDIPESVPELSVTNPPPVAETVDETGFERIDGTLHWQEDDQSTRAPSVTFTQSVNETTDDGRLKYADTGDWALIKRPPQANIEYSYYEDPGQPTVTRTNRTAGEGVSSNAMVYLGPYEMTNESAHGQQFRLIVPEAAALTEEPRDIFDSVAAASDALRVGDRDETVTMFAAPTSVSWGVRGLQRGDDAFYTVANRSVDAPDNTWVHEYVHTRQNFETTNATQWVIEASAEYYGAQLTLQQGRIDFDAFAASIGVGADRRFDDVTLAAPDTWHDAANYNKGGLVAGDIDRRIRLATDSETSLQRVFQRLNEYDSRITQQRFVQSVERAGGASVADTTRQFTETTDGPEMWPQHAHDEAFGDLPAQFTATFPAVGSDGLRAHGPFRNGTITDAGLVTNETLVADIAVENVGGVAGTYDITVTRDGTPVANRTGTADAGERVVETVEFPFDGPGIYRLSTGSDSLDVRVSEPATPTVTDVSANRTTVEESGVVSVTATVGNGDDIPATGVVSLQQNGETLLERQVSLARGDSTEMTTTVRLTELGSTTFSAGDQSVDVTVEEAGGPPPDGAGETADESDDDTVDETAGGSGPGFGLVGTLLALAALLLVGHRVE